MVMKTVTNAWLLVKCAAVVCCCCWRGTAIVWLLRFVVYSQFVTQDCHNNVHLTDKPSLAGSFLVFFSGKERFGKSGTDFYKPDTLPATQITMLKRW